VVLVVAWLRTWADGDGLRVPCFALEYVELVCDMHCGFSGIPHWVGRAGCGWRFYVVAGASGC
jgi:hypothetical protein